MGMEVRVGCELQFNTFSSALSLAEIKRLRKYLEKSLAASRVLIFFLAHFLKCGRILHQLLNPFICFVLLFTIEFVAVDQEWSFQVTVFRFNHLVDFGLTLWFPGI